MLRELRNTGIEVLRAPRARRVEVAVATGTVGPVELHAGQQRLTIVIAGRSQAFRVSGERGVERALGKCLLPCWRLISRRHGKEADPCQEECREWNTGNAERESQQN